MNRFILAAVAALCTAIAPASAQDKYPSRTIKVLVPYAPGGAVDIVARIVTEQMRHTLGQPLVVENKPGAFGIIAMEEMARARPDGYTLMFGNVNTNGITPVLYKKKMSINYEKDITAVARVADVSAFLAATTKDFPPKTFAEFVAYAKANPGKVNMASAGSGSAPHMAGELFKMMTGVDMVHVPYRGQGPAMTDLLGGQVQILFAAAPGTADYVRTNKLRALAVTTTARMPDLPEVPSVGDFVAGYEASQWYGFAAPKNTPVEIVDKLNKEINAAMADPGMKAKLAAIGGEIMPGSPAEFGRLIVEETDKWGKVVRTAGIKPE